MFREPRIALAVPSGDAGADATARPERLRLSGRIVAIGALVAVLFASVAIWQLRPAENPAIASSTAITAEQLEQQYGVKLGIVGLLASGGLLELKFQVVDADKATALFGEVADMPLLAVEGSTSVLESSKGMKHQLTILDGASYFFLYTNVADAVHAGSTVAFVINGQRVPHLEVQQ